MVLFYDIVRIQNFHNIQMLTNYSGAKLRVKHSPEMHYTSHRPDSHLHSQLHQKDKACARRVNTEANEPDIAKNKVTLKGGSPGLKRNIVQMVSPTNKLSFNTAGKIKRVKKAALNERVATESGPFIPKGSNQPIKVEKRQIVEYSELRSTGGQKENTFQAQKDHQGHLRKHTDSKSPQQMFSRARMQYSSGSHLATRLHTEGSQPVEVKEALASWQSVKKGDLEILEVVGQGTFGQVFKARVRRTGEVVAVKRVFQDPKYKNREVEIVGMLKGNFVMRVLGTFATRQEEGQFLNIVMECYDKDLYALIRQQGRKGLNTYDIKVFAYQIFRGLLFIHQLKVSHRDMKPHNVLIKGKKAVICDFGSAKVLTGQANLPYICSRCYRAPELIFGATHYTTMVDIWSVGCILLEMLNGTPLFIGDTSIDHLIEIIKVLGTPTKTQVIEMNPNYDLDDYRFPKIKTKEWKKIFPKADPLLLDLIDQVMIYAPKQRLNAAEALAHEFFDQLREENVHKMLQHRHGLTLFDFSREELQGYGHLADKLIPQWAR